MRSRMEFYPSGQERKEARAQSEELKEKIKRSGEKGFGDGRYTWLNSTLDGYDRESFQGMFRDIIPAGPSGDRSLRRYIERTLAERNGEAIGIEFGGVGSRAFGEFTPGFFKRSFGITLIDHYKNFPRDLRDRNEKDAKRHHEVLEGDIFSKETYAALDGKLEGEKVDLIIERMAAGLESVPPDPYLVAECLGNWYRMLREGGILFAQAPVAMNRLLRPWMKMVREDYSGVIEIAGDIGSENDGSRSPSILRLRKLPGAPDEIPLLDPRTVRAISTGKTPS